VTLPDSVRQFGTRKAETLKLDALRVALHGQGFVDRAATENLALGYPAPVPGWFNIGVLHTSLSGRPPHANYAPCSVEELRSRGYDYWALGHVHAFEVVANDPPMVFPGNLQGRNIRESGPKGAVIVTVSDGRVTAIDPLIVDDARWATLALDLDGIGDLTALLAVAEAAIKVEAVAAEGRPLALRLQMRGATPLRPWLLANRSAAFDELQAAAHRLHAEIWVEKLELRLAASAIAAPTASLSIDLEGLLGAVADDPDLTVAADGLIREIAAKLPGGLGAAFDEDAASLLAEAREIVLQRVLAER
jgi:DNA repair exonuclease SbcCD nuclease subunit